MASTPTSPSRPKQQVHFSGHGKDSVRAHGVVSEVSMHPNKKHASMRVRHGAAAKEDGPYADYGENETRVPVMAVEHAKRFKVGQKVVVHIGPDDGQDDSAPKKSMPAAKPGSKLDQTRGAVKAALAKKHTAKKS